MKKRLYGVIAAGILLLQVIFPVFVSNTYAVTVDCDKVTGTKLKKNCKSQKKECNNKTDANEKKQCKEDLAKKIGECSKVADSTAKKNCFKSKFGTSGSSDSGSNSDSSGYNTGTKAKTNSTCGGVETSILDCEDSSDGSALFHILAIALSIVTYGVGAVGVVGVMIVGFQYMSARDNPAQVAKAKNRLLQIVIGLAIWVVFWGVLQFLLPGGLFGDGS